MSYYYPKDLENITIDKLEIDIQSCEAGCIYFNINLGKQCIKITASSVFDPFDDILSWLEAIAVGVNRCSFTIDEEGTKKIFELKYTDDNIYKFILFSDDKVILEAYIDKVQFINSFYSSFVNFYNSDKYNKDENEAYFIYEKFDLVFERSIFDDSILELLLSFDGNQLRKLFLYFKYMEMNYNSSKSLKSNFMDYIKIIKKQHNNLCEEYSSWFKSFNNESLKYKVKMIQQACNEDIKDLSYGFRLCDFKSNIIEKLILEKSKKDYFNIDTIDFKYSLSYEEYENDIITYLHIDTYINNIKIFPNLIINIFFLEYSIQTDKIDNYPLFVCNCGDEGCGGVDTSPIVRVEDDLINWYITDPKKYLFRFNKNNFVKKIENFKQQLLKEKSIEKWKNIHYTYGSMVSDFLETNINNGASNE